MSTPSRKICSKCRVNKPIDGFYKHVGHKYGVSSACKNCIRKQHRAFYQENPKKRTATNKKYMDSPKGRATRDRYRQTSGYKFNRWKYWLRDEYGLTVEQYGRMLKTQNSCCAICNKPETASNQYGLMRLAIDHGHTTGKIRGLLCQRCNQALGLMNEDAWVLEKAIEYLSRAYQK